MGEVLIPIKVVPGASRDQISGMLGERLKIRISAPAEGGKANAAVCRLIAQKLGIKNATVEVASGSTNPEKIIRIAGDEIIDTQSALDLLIS